MLAVAVIPPGRCASACDRHLSIWESKAGPRGVATYMSW
jgi:hypothetical protein